MLFGVISYVVDETQRVICHYKVIGVLYTFELITDPLYWRKHRGDSGSEIPA